MTPHQLNLVIKEFSRHKQESYEDKISIAYYQARWTYDWFTKEKPRSLEKILGKEKQNKPEEQTDEEMLLQVMELNKALGGITF